MGYTPKQRLAYVAGKTGISWQTLYYKRRQGYITLPMTEEEMEQLKKDFRPRPRKAKK